MKITTIKLQKPTKDRLEKLRSYKRESYDEILQKILNVLNTVIHDPDQARSKLASIERQRRSLNAKKRKTVKKKQAPRPQPQSRPIRQARTTSSSPK